MAGEEIERLVRGLADREAIRDLPLRYCDCVWRQDPAGLADLYTKDGRFDPGTGDPEVESAAGIREYMERTLPAARPLPLIHNHVFELAPDGQSATGRCSVEITMTRDGERSSVIGYYEDEYAREDGRWKFRARRATLVA